MNSHRKHGMDYSHYTWRFPANVLFRGLILFMIVKLLFLFCISIEELGRISLYNILFTGRDRLPFGENPTLAYNLSLYNLNAMMNSHKLAGPPKPPDEFRVVVVGDSSIWGILLKPEDTLTGNLNKLNIRTKENKRLRFYNLGYPTLSLIKDLMILEESKRFQPDMIIWLVTLESFPEDNQLASPLVVNNSEQVNKIIENYYLPLPEFNTGNQGTNFWHRTFVGKRRMLADLFRLQLYGIPWSATGVDQVYPKTYEPARRDFEADISFNDWEPSMIQSGQLNFVYLAAARQMLESTPILLVNEPILISSGKNSNLRYNFYYPRWAYDQYREKLEDYCIINGWHYLDVWDQIADSEFTNSAIHLSPMGSAELARMISNEIRLMDNGQFLGVHSSP